MQEAYLQYLERLAVNLPLLLLNKPKEDNIKTEEWPVLKKLLRFHGLLPFFVEFKGLKHFHPNNKVKEEILNQVKTITANNLKILSVQNELDRLLNENNIQFLFFKGIYLSQILYNNATIRPLLDIDVLIDPAKEKEARSLLLANGAKETKYLQNKFIQRFTSHGVPLLYKNVLLEFHQNIIKIKNNDLCQVINPWNYTQEYNITGKKTLTFNPVFYLWYLCFHAHKHLAAGKIKLLWYVDIACLIKKYGFSEIHFTKTIELAKKIHTEKEINITLSLILKYFLPQDENLKKTSLPDLPEKYKRLFINLIHKTVVYTNRNYYIDILKDLSYLGKIFYILSILFPSISYIQTRFGLKSKIAAYFFLLINPFRVVFKFFRIILLRNTKNPFASSNKSIPFL